jgi:UDP-N-acetylglucosamine--N-acetylmuramyl-(pentapeptide) pyrophosphoryl-undecaprenol N-acetylglucosamine transferase
MNLKRAIHIVFAGGGTLGHLFPGLAVAEELAAQVHGLQITFAGSGKEGERRHVAAAGFEYCALPCRPLPRRARDTVSFVVENLAGYFAAGRFLDDADVAAVVGLGGYASVAMGRAASRRHVPLILLEQNVLPGRANRWLARSASLACVTFAQSEPQLGGRCRVRVTGNPLRTGKASCFAYDRFPPRSMPQRRLLVLGGSSGARSLNETVPRALR